MNGNRRFRQSKNDYDWLGDGIYFWENDPRRALEWAGFMAGHPRFKSRVKKSFVVGAVIELGNCLDLTEGESLELLKTAYNHLANAFHLNNTSLPKNEPADSSDSDLIRCYLDCAVVNALHDLRDQEELEPFDTVRGPFFEGEQLYPGARIQKKTHIQLCVREPAMIRGVFHIPAKA